MNRLNVETAIYRVSIGDLKRRFIASLQGGVINGKGFLGLQNNSACVSNTMIRVLDEWQSDHATVRSAGLLTLR
jgi:hypothetical protein